MKSILKSTTLEKQFPLLSVERGCIVSKDADVTVAYRVTLPELFTVTTAEYESMHGTWLKALKVLPTYTVVHKQDWFTTRRYCPDLERCGSDFLSHGFERHFNERSFLDHCCYLFLTKTTRERMRSQSVFSTLCRSRIVPKEIEDREAVGRFLDAAGQFESIVNESGLIRLERMDTDGILGTGERSGLLDRYFSLSHEERAVLEDIRLDPGQMRIGNKFLCMHTLSDLDDLPQAVRTDGRYERLSTDRSDCRLSYASPVGLLLDCDHLYNQFVFIDDHEETLRMFERSAKNMNSLSRYSRANAINKEWIDLFLNEAHSQGLTCVRCHCNVMAWTDNYDELRRIKNEVGSQLALMECTPHHNTVDMPTLYWGAIPGNEGDFPAEESFYTFMEQALCFFTAETNYPSSPSPFGIKMVDRLRGIPLHLDISDLPMKKGVITNRNKFIVGPSGSGKSFFTNHLVRQYYEQGTHVVLVDTGNSYRGLCELIHRKTGGEDGIYLTYTEQEPIAFNPFYTESGEFDIEKRESIKTLILTLWKCENELPTRAEEVALSNAVSMFLSALQRGGKIVPSFNSFYEFVREDYRKILRQKNVREKDFDINNCAPVKAA